MVCMSLVSTMHTDGFSKSYPGPDPSSVIPDVMIRNGEPVDEAPWQAHNPEHLRSIGMQCIITNDV
jgi:hypothetical protein